MRFGCSRMASRARAMARSRQGRPIPDIPERTRSPRDESRAGKHRKGAIPAGAPGKRRGTLREACGSSGRPRRRPSGRPHLAFRRARGRRISSTALRACLRRWSRPCAARRCTDGRCRPRRPADAVRRLLVRHCAGADDAACLELARFALADLPGDAEKWEARFARAMLMDGRARQLRTQDGRSLDDGFSYSSHVGTGGLPRKLLILNSKILLARVLQHPDADSSQGAFSRGT